MSTLVRGARALASVVVRAFGATVGRVLVWALTAVIRLYQLTVSPMLAPTCRYHPSCSRYAAESLRTHGAVKGSLLAGWRLLRCNPWTAGGLDPVPPEGAWRPTIRPDGRPRADGGPGTDRRPRPDVDAAACSRDGTVHPDATDPSADPVLRTA